MHMYVCLLIMGSEGVLLNYNNEYFPPPYSNLLSFPTAGFFQFPNGGFSDVVRQAFEEKLGCQIELECPVPYFYEEKRGGRFFFIFKANLCGGNIEKKIPDTSISAWKGPKEITRESANEWVLSALEYFKNK